MDFFSQLPLLYRVGLVFLCSHIFCFLNQNELTDFFVLSAENIKLNFYNLELVSSPVLPTSKIPDEVVILKERSWVAYLYSGFTLTNLYRLTAGLTLIGAGVLGLSASYKAVIVAQPYVESFMSYVRYFQKLFNVSTTSEDSRVISQATASKVNETIVSQAASNNASASNLGELHKSLSTLSTETNGVLESLKPLVCELYDQGLLKSEGGIAAAVDLAKSSVTIHEPKTFEDIKSSYPKELSPLQIPDRTWSEWTSNYISNHIKQFGAGGVRFVLVESQEVISKVGGSAIDQAIPGLVPGTGYSIVKGAILGVRCFVFFDYKAVYGDDKSASVLDPKKVVDTVVDPKKLVDNQLKSDSSLGPNESSPVSFWARAFLIG